MDGTLAKTPRSGETDLVFTDGDTDRDTGTVAAICWAWWASCFRRTLHWATDADSFCFASAAFCRSCSICC